jgi:hypothetical protein
MLSMTYLCVMTRPYSHWSTGFVFIPDKHPIRTSLIMSHLPVLLVLLNMSYIGMKTILEWTDFSSIGKYYFFEFNNIVKFVKIRTGFVFIPDKHPIRTSYSLNTMFWLDNFREWVRKIVLECVITLKPVFLHINLCSRYFYILSQTVMVWLI